MKHWLGNFLLRDTKIPYSTVSSTATFKVPVTNVNGESITSFNTLYSLQYCTFGVQSKKTSNDTSGVLICLGSGSTLQTVNDTYCLESDITQKLTLGSITSNVDYLDDKVRLVLTARYTNNSEENLTISEAGLATHVVGNSGNTIVLLDRKSVADGNFTPVTLGSGEGKTFVYAIEL